VAVAASDQYDRCLVGQDASLSMAPTDEDGEPTAIGAPSSVVVCDGSGTQVKEPLAVTVADVLAVTIPASYLALLDTFTLTWSGKVGADTVSWDTTLETVGGFYFNFAQFRAQGDEFVSASAASVRGFRRAVEEFIEDRCKCAFVPRGQRESIAGDGSSTLVLAHEPIRQVYSLSVTEKGATADWTTEEIAALEGVDCGMLHLPERWTGAWPPGQQQPGVWKRDAVVTIHYAYGLDRPSPKMSRAAAYLARLEAFPDTRSSPNAVLQLTEFGNFRIATPDADHPTGIPWIDELLDREGHYAPSVG
jgi:hypothetical protein